MFYKKVISIITGMLVLPIMTMTQEEINTNLHEEVTPIILSKDEEIEYDVSMDVKFYEKVVSEMQTELENIKSLRTENKKEWFIRYRKLIEKYKGIIDTPLSIYDYFSQEEIYLIQRTVETECYDASFESKTNVASVIFNRLNGEEVYGNSIEEVLTKENQFANWRTDITEDTVLAVEYAYQIEDTTNGCIGFRSDVKIEKWYEWGYAFTDEAGHHFYK